MPSEAHPRQRASKACQRCSQRKVKCDASRGYQPCSRCRMDGVEHCILPVSQRGTYDRRKRRRESSLPPNAGSTGSSSNRGPEALSSGAGSSITTSDIAMAAHEPSNDGTHGTSRSQAGSDLSILSVAQPLTARGPNAANQAVRTITGANPQSLATMFEDFLERENDDSDRLAPKVGLVFFGETSPLTFALEELNQGTKAQLQDAVNDLSRSQQREKQPHGSHPHHCAQEDIAYLQAKGAFSQPEPEFLDQLIAAFVDKFYPLYSIVDKTELLESHKAGHIPWILLHAICFIGATFCDSSVIYESRHKSRFHARRLFYDRAKILFDVGYETDKFILLQTVIMLTFWGPQMKSYWNPYSWIGFGVTIAGSLGIHRSTPAPHASGKDKGLVKRLWWALAVRDAYCATLLGRPFRIRMEQCDTEMLTTEDFPHGSEYLEHALYQIQIAKLSLILRTITERLFGPGQYHGDVSDLYEQLENWQAQTPLAVRDGTKSTSTNDVFAAALKLMYHHHNILIHLGQVGDNSERPEHSPTYPDALSTAKAYSSAQTISSTAAMLVTKRMTNQLPHEVFAGFFFAGIVFYRQQQQELEQQERNLIVQMARASLDNCQLLLNEVRDSWDPAYWILRIFDFLRSTPASSNKTAGNLPQQESNDPAAGSEAMAYSIPADFYPSNSYSIVSDNNDFLYPVDWGSPNQDLMGLFNNFPLMSGYFTPSGD